MAEVTVTDDLDGDGKFRMKRQINFLSATSIITGIIIGCVERFCSIELSQFAISHYFSLTNLQTKRLECFMT